jgi:O-antigen/teichoic acid export membrane protein
MTGPNQTDAGQPEQSGGSNRRDGDSRRPAPELASTESAGALRAAGSPLRRLFVHTSHYSFTSALNMVAGLITFPILTRVFSVADYGVMNLVAATLTISVAVGKMGVQHSIIRYHSEITSGKGTFTLPQLSSSTLLPMLGGAALVALVLGIGAQLVPSHWLGDERVPHLLGIAAVVVVVQVPESALVNLLRAEQKTSSYLAYQVSKKYLGLALILSAVLLVARNLTSFYVAMATGEVLAVAILAYWTFRSRPKPSLSQFSRPLYGELLRFGVPMFIGYELSGIILAVGDRYVIQGVLGPGPLGLYSAGYNLCQYVQSVFIASVSQAIMPLYMEMWDRKGREETAAFIARSFRTYVLLSGPVIAGLAAVGPELLPALASEKYVSSAGILSWVIAGMVVDGSASMLGAGLYIHRKTRLIMPIVAGGALLNLVLNIVLVPRFGIRAAAVATLISYTLTALAMGLAGRRLLPVAIPWATMIRTALGSVVMLVAVQWVYPGHRLATVGLRVVLGAVIYLVVMLLIDQDARAMTKKGLARVRRAKEGAGRS